MMVLNNMFEVNNFISVGLQATALRNSVINNNIANAETPGFTRSIVEFESHLSNEIVRARQSGTDINFANIMPTVQLSMESVANGLDANNVDIEMEMASLYINSARFEAMSISVMNNYRRINVALNSNI